MDAQLYINKTYGGTAIMGTKRDGICHLSDDPGEGIAVKTKAQSADGQSKTKRPGVIKNGTTTTTTQATTQEKDTGDEELDELNKDGKDDDIPSLKAPEWKTEMLNTRQQVLLEKKSDVFNSREMFLEVSQYTSN
ncbi:hypothetical protein IFM47457_01600 [Aspergillus lentulus]|nr:hypothetical protein IFM47457_01600 [Aspergillus lentulus]